MIAQLKLASRLYPSPHFFTHLRVIGFRSFPESSHGVTDSPTTDGIFAGVIDFPTTDGIFAGDIVVTTTDGIFAGDIVVQTSDGIFAGDAISKSESGILYGNISCDSIYNPFCFRISLFVKIDSYSFNN
jgi:hypothetical protein